MFITHQEGNIYENVIELDINIKENYENNKDAVMEVTLNYVKEMLNKNQI